MHGGLFMNHIVCIDYENRADIKNLCCYSDVKYVSFIGKDQKDNLKAQPGTRLSRKRMDQIGKVYLDWHIIDYIKNRLNTGDTKFLIVSDDGIFDSFARYVNMTYNERIVEKISRKKWQTLNMEAN